MVIFVVLSAIFEVGMTTYLRHSNIIVFKAWNEIYDKKINAEIIYSGPSRGQNHYNPVVIDSILGTNSYNLGMKGMMVNQQIMRYHAYLRQQNALPQLFVMNIDYGTMDVISGYAKAQSYPYFYTDRQLMEDFDAYEHFSWQEKYIPGYRYLYKNSELWKSIGKQILHPESSDLLKGHLPIYANWDGSVFEKMDSLHYEQHPEAIRLFDDFMKELTESGVQVVLVYSPVYAEATKKMVNIEGMYMMYDTLASKYNIPILDYNYDSMCEDTLYFANASHMNILGADVFSRKLASDLQTCLQNHSK